jgi:2-polyprenyl-3-methyl-5-hydroxy-6-metoxy-1,4-benzoquinol methylase
MYDIKTRGINTEEHWSETHKSRLENWQYKEDDIKGFIKQFDTQFYYQDALRRICKDDKTVLELGCGLGNPLACLALMKREVKFTGIDFTDSFLEYGKKLESKIPNISFEKRDFLLSPVQEEYDIIMMLETLEHIEEGTNYKLVKDLLGKCKKLFISVPEGDNSNGGEHISFYNLNSFDHLVVLEKFRTRHLYFFVIRGDLC